MTRVEYNTKRSEGVLGPLVSGEVGKLSSVIDKVLKSDDIELTKAEVNTLEKADEYFKQIIKEANQIGHVG